ncbi:hypothetical protein RND71_031961 [Anisodus tanguticus]|uniref:Uncharacterized protein n=1 Tax=Anisodus tanguticus TaxID=243964 RepID=A0AAE1RDN1_9SOLA|nr:hypothetical protein RND71_031961 [Anisodus tanguticus]
MKEPAGASADEVVVEIDSCLSNSNKVTPSAHMLEVSRKGTRRRNSKLLVKRKKSRLEDTVCEYKLLDKVSSKDKDEDWFIHEEIVEESISKKLNLWTVLQLDLPLWKWEIFLSVIISGYLLCGWVVRVVVFCIEHGFLQKLRVLYCVWTQKGFSELPVGSSNCDCLAVLGSGEDGLREEKQSIAISNKKSALHLGGFLDLVHQVCDKKPIRLPKRSYMSNLGKRSVKRLGRLIPTFSTFDEEFSDLSDEEDEESSCSYAEKLARKIFKKVAKGSESIGLEDLKCFVAQEKALKSIDLFEGIEEEACIDQQSFISWMVEAFKERRYILLSLNDAKTAVETVFEAIIFLFIMHPFDVGDRCEVDGVQASIIFIASDGCGGGEYSNCIREIRLPKDQIEFSMHISTPWDKIVTMKEKIKRYIESHDNYWYSEPVIIVKDVQDMNRLTNDSLATAQNEPSRYGGEMD